MHQQSGLHQLQKIRGSLDPFQEDPSLPGELSLRMYKEVQERSEVNSGCRQEDTATAAKRSHEINQVTNWCHLFRLGEEQIQRDQFSNHSGVVINAETCSSRKRKTGLKESARKKGAVIASCKTAANTFTSLQKKLFSFLQRLVYNRKGVFLTSITTDVRK